MHRLGRNVYQAFACRVWIQGRGVAAGQRAKDAFKNALKWIRERCTERLNGFRKNLLVHSKACITCGGAAIRKHFSTDNCNTCFHLLGRCFVGTKSCFDSLAVVESFVCLRSRLGWVSGIPSCCFPLN